MDVLNYQIEQAKLKELMNDNQLLCLQYLTIKRERYLANSNNNNNNNNNNKNIINNRNITTIL